MNMGIKEVSVFKSLKTLKSLDKNSFADGKPKLDGGLPAQIDDPEEAKEIEEKSDWNEGDLSSSSPSRHNHATVTNAPGSAACWFYIVAHIFYFLF